MERSGVNRLFLGVGSGVILFVVESVWLAGIGLVLLVSGVRIFRFGRLLRLAEPAPAYLQAETAELARRIGLRYSPRMYLVPGSVSPMLWALLGSHRLLFPAELLPRLDRTARQTILVHELVHLHRGDYWLRFLELLATAVYWWHPVVWWVRRQLHQAEEEVCDARVVAALPDSREAYATAVVEASRFLSRTRSPLPAVASGIGGFVSIRQRVTRIMLTTDSGRLSVRNRIAVVVMALACLSLTPTLGQVELQQTGEEQSTPGNADSTQPAKPEKRRDPDLGDQAYPPRMEGAQVEIYKTVGDTQLKLYLFTPENHKPGAKRPAIVFFFGGGWRSGNPRQFEQHCRYLARRGMVAAAADYRVTTRHNSKGIDSVRDAKSAIRWLRANADHLGVDPARIAAGGGSAGGHLAATTGVVPGLDETNEDSKFSSVPNALVLFNPFLVAVKVPGSGLDYPPDITESAGIEPIKISPYHHVQPGRPPIIIFHGKDDKTVPYRTAEMFTEKMLGEGNRCELVGYDGADHGFFNYRWTDGTAFVDTVHRMDRFLVSLGYLQGEPLPLDARDASRAARTPRAVSLRVERVQGTRPPAGWPVTTGVPFRDGQLSNQHVGSLRLETAAGTPVPAQFEVRGRYPRSKNVRWLGVDFPLDPAVKEYRLVLDGKSGPAHPQPVRVSQEQEAFFVTTGDLKVEVPRRGSMVKRVWLKDDLLLEQSLDSGNWLTTVDGTRNRERGATAVIEREGPLHVTIRVDGHYADPAGKPSCRWTARLHFYAGQPTIHLVHTFTWIGRADRFKIRDLALSFGLPRPATEAAADKSDETVGESVSRRLQPGEMLSLLQDEYWHWGHGQSHFGILAGHPDRLEEITSGKRAGSWIGTSDGRAAVTLALRDLWQQFPKELRAEPKRLTAYLWSSQGKTGPLDLSYDALERFWGPAVVEQLRTGGTEGAGYQRTRSIAPSNDPTGVAKTHDLLLIFGKGSPASAAAAAEAFDAPPLVLPDPQWTTQSDVLGRIWPKDEQRFPKWERWIDQAWSDVFHVLDDWGDYGFFSYGDGPHQRYDFRSGRAVASVWRYTMPCDYGVHKAAWLGWLRSGDRRFYDFAVARTRFLNDIAICHEESPTRWKGSWTASFAPIPWGTAGGIRSQPQQKVGAFEFFIDHALLHYYLTGDQRSLDVAQEYATALREMISLPDWAREWVRTMNDSLSRWYFHRIEDLATCYEQFGDPWFYQKSVELANLGTDLADSSGIVRDAVSGKERKTGAKYPSYLFYKAPNLLAYQRNLQGPEWDRARQAFVKTVEHAFRTQSIETRSIGPRMAYGYYFTKDPRLLAFGVKRLDEEMRHSMEKGRGAKGYATAVTQSGAFRASAVNALVNASHLMAALAESPPTSAEPPVPVLWKQLCFPPVQFALLKEKDKPLQIELSASPSTTFTGPDGTSLLRTWMGTPVTYWPHNDGIQSLNPEEPLLYRAVSMPAQAAAGEVWIRVGQEGIAHVLATNASRAVMVAPQGFYLGGGLKVLPGGRAVGLGGGFDDCWYFRVAQGTKTFRLATSDPSRLVLRDSAARGAALKPLGNGQYSVAVTGAAAEGLWSVRAQEVVDVAFADILPVFAYRDPQLYFAPGDIQVVRDFPVRPEASGRKPRRP
jgi:acetyl esterase/lipase